MRGATAVTGSDTKSRPIIAVDCDDVLAVSFAAFLEWHNERYKTAWTVTDITNYCLDKVFGGTAEDWCDRFRLFQAEGGFARLERVDGAAQAVAALKQHFDLIVVTSRGEHLRAVTEAWVHKNFPNTFKKICMCNHWTPDDAPKESKGQVCVREGAVALIDDFVDYCSEAVQHVPLVVNLNLHGQYNWSRLPPDGSPVQFTVCMEWPDVVATISKHFAAASTRKALPFEPETAVSLVSTQADLS